MDALNNNDLFRILQIDRNLRMKEVYTFENKGGVKIRELKLGGNSQNPKDYQIIKQEGSCIGYVISWLKHMLDGKNPQFHFDFALSQMLVGKGAQIAYDLELMVTETCKTKYLIAKLKNYGSTGFKSNIENISLKDGFYLIDFGGNDHIVGAGKTGGKWYYFDPNFALFDTNNRDNFVHHICSDVLTYYNESRGKVTVFKVRNFTQQEMLEFSWFGK